MFPAARKGDATGHGGAIVTGSPSVLINEIPAALVGLSSATCPLHPSAQAVVVGSATVFINDLPAALVSGMTSCGAPISAGSPDVLIGS
ncbi:PAAR domain-containing protein [Paraburkholderia susongensis]|uniref:Zn-binding Pro-Ala-Ala-Arg (PAAR) domain-containing protein, incolved in TypeVI secretion n=1 Tax=Paraburkholderia susongensis TaxID=1515439 RepID=A0A1X7LM08_9BURK|nr:PAAR domain-containing protein [Paraburkholderia susongensis]SMG54189.1 Zn-binding Pro-Ala-Ala-Arg (PAAR) domain-containing protein, incolved in TypeVI secretion [Paraburkholderia susongensis]